LSKYRLFVKTHRPWQAAGGEDTEYIFSTYDDASTAQELLMEISLDASSETLHESFIDEVLPPKNSYPAPSWLQAGTRRWLAQRIEKRNND